MAELKRLIETKQKYFLIDVRNKDELGYGIIPTAQNIPLHEIGKALDMDEEEFSSTFSFEKFSEQDQVIFYCRTGGRSKTATEIAFAKGYTNSKNFAGSIWEWSTIDQNVKRYFH